MSTRSNHQDFISSVLHSRALEEPMPDSSAGVVAFLRTKAESARSDEPSGSSLLDRAETDLGSDAMPNVFLMENHDDAYYRWRRAGAKQRTLIHIDAHHDMWWSADETQTNIANFICPGLKEEMVREVFWVVPDQTWELSTSRKAVLRHVKQIAARYPQSGPAIQMGDKKISAVVLGKPLTICSVDGLPSIDEDVLLDIDVDYLVIPYVCYGEGDAHGPLPWCWPDELVAKLRDRQIRSDFATISYSVEGGYTPLKWKYLGDELAERLRETDLTDPLLMSMALIREGAVATFRRDFGVAEVKYSQAVKMAPDFAATHYHLAQFYLEMNRIPEARESYQRAVAIDPSYRTACNTAGVLHQSDGHFKSVEGEIGRALQLDPEDSYGHYGLARIALERKQWAEAEASLKKSLACNDQLIDAHRALGSLLSRQGRYDEAMRAYESSMKLALSGHATFAGPILTNDGAAARLKDPEHCRIHARLAYLHEMKGETEKAIISYRISIAGGYDRIWVRVRLARLYLRQGHGRSSAREFWQAANQVPAMLRIIMKRSRRQQR